MYRGLIIFATFSILAVYLFFTLTAKDSSVKFVVSSKGELWPKAQYEAKFRAFYTYTPTFHTETTNHTCRILQRAIKRFQRVTKNLYDIANYTRYDIANYTRCHNCSYNGQGESNLHNNSKSTTTVWDLLKEKKKKKIKKLLVELRNPCEEIPYLNMDEKYKLTIEETSRLSGDSIWGILRGLETASQLFYLSNNYTEVRINRTIIVDFPSYPHRGLLLDTARHYISPDIIFMMLDAMAMNKMNVFHWHIVDDQSFPYQSTVFPELSEKGAFSPTMIYNASIIKSIIAYAHNRGIRVLPEFDVPGQLHKCPLCKISKALRPMNPLKNITYKVIDGLFDEVQKVFPDPYFHIGGDEVDFYCWQSNPDIQNFMKEHNITDIKRIHAMFTSKVLKLLDNKTTPVVWQELFDNGVQLPKNSVIQIWKSDIVSEMLKILKSGHKIILSEPWYLDSLDNTFEKMYTKPPKEMVRASVNKNKIKFNEDDLENILGGEACMWSEKVNDSNVLPRTWPRASVMAELLWSSERNILQWRSVEEESLPEAILQRAVEHACRMRLRGVPVTPFRSSRVQSACSILTNRMRLSHPNAYL